MNFPNRNLPQANENGTLYYTHDKIIDTESGFNYVNANIPALGPMNVPVNQDYDKMIKRWVKQSRNFWLETNWRDLVSYVVLDGNKVRLAKDKKEKKHESKNIYHKFDDKIAYLKDKYFDKHDMKKVIKKYLQHNPLVNDMFSYEQMLQEYIHSKVKSRIKKHMKKNH